MNAKAQGYPGAIWPRGAPRARRPFARARRAAPPLPRPLAVCLLAVLAVLTLGGCLRQLELQQQPQQSCSQVRLDAAASLHEESKQFLGRHFKERDNRSLLYAYYASQDTEELSKSIRYCDDFDPIFRQRGTELIRATRILRRVVVGNMRDTDPSVLVHLLGPAYDDVFRGDIR